MRLIKELIIPAGLLSSLIIGAGMFSLPYLFSQAGMLAGLGYLAIFGVVMAVVHLMYAEVIQGTEGDHRFVGYARIYLGNFGFYASFLTTVIGLVLSLLIYLVLSSSFIKIILPGLDATAAAIVFWALGTVPIILGVKKFADLGFAVTLAMIAAIAAIFIFGVSSFDARNITLVNWSGVYLPFTAVLFSLAGRSAISSIKKYLAENNLSAAKFDWAIFLGTFAPAALYAIFAIGVIGLSKGVPSPDAVSGLIGLPMAMLIIFAILGVLSLWTSYIFLGFEFKDILSSDFKIKGALAAISAAVLPLALYFFGLNDFIRLIGISGGVFLAAESIMVVLMWSKLKKQDLVPRLCAITIVFVFLAALIYELSKPIR